MRSALLTMPPALLICFKTGFARHATSFAHMDRAPPALLTICFKTHGPCTLRHCSCRASTSLAASQVVGDSMGGRSMAAGDPGMADAALAVREAQNVLLELAARLPDRCVCVCVCVCVCARARVCVRRQFLNTTYTFVCTCGQGLHRRCQAQGGGGECGNGPEGSRAEPSPLPRALDARVCRVRGARRQRGRGGG